MIDAIPFSREAKLVLAEATDIARRSGQPMDSAHVVLGLFAVRCEAQSILLEKRIDFDRVLDLLPRVSREAPETVTVLYDHAARIASNVGSRNATSVHMLMAIARLANSRAARVLESAGLSMFDLRTQAMAHLTDPFLRRQASRRIDAVGSARSLPSAPPVPVPVAAPVSSPAWPGPAPRLAGVSGGGAPAAAPAGAPVRRPFPPPPPTDDDLPVVFEDDGAEILGEDGALDATECDEALPALPPEERAPGTPAGAPAGARTVPGDGPAPRGAAPRGHAARWHLDPDRYPTLTALGRNLNAEAAAGRVDPLVGRDDELDAVVDILCKRRSNNPMLLGDPGVGKTALVEGLALLVVQRGDDLPGLAGRVIVSVSVADLVAGTVMRGSFAARLRALKDEVLASDGRVILFIDEIHTLMGAGVGDGGMDAANDLKGALARGELPCIGATTFGEYKRYILSDPALKRRFEAVTLREPSLDEAERILSGVAPRYEAWHGVRFTPDALRAAVRLTDRLVPDRSLPAKAIDVLDRAGARVRREGRAEVGREDVVRVLSALVDLPREHLALSPTERLLEMERFLGQRVFGQDAALSSVVRTLAQNWSRFGTRRPLGSFVLAGPGGSGRHTLAVAVAEFLFGTPQALLEVDLGDYNESHALSHLIGSPPGYVGHEEGGLLADTLVKRPFLVVLWRHPEQAHPSVLSLLAQILGEGTVTDRRGRRMDFRNTVHLVAAGGADDGGSGASRPMGFGAPSDGGERPEAVAARLRRVLPSDLLQAVDAVLPFPRPGASAQPRILARLLEEAARSFRDEHGLALRLDAGVPAILLARLPAGEAPGAALEAAVARSVIAPATDAVFRGLGPALGVVPPLDGDGRFEVLGEEEAGT